MYSPGPTCKIQQHCSSSGYAPVCFLVLLLFVGNLTCNQTNSYTVKQHDNDQKLIAASKSEMLGLEAEKPGLGLGLGLVSCGLGLVSFGLGLVGFGLEPRGLSRLTAETERNVIGSESITNFQKSLLPLRIAS